MKTLKVITILFLISTIFSCQDDNDETIDNNQLLKFNVKSTSLTDDSITLEWKDVKGVSWYFVEYKTAGKEKQETAGYQDLTNETITYTLKNLKPGKEYEIIVNGKDYLSGGKLIATSEKIKVSTKELDPIVGVWYPFSDENKEESECRKKSTFTFTKDGNWKSIGIIQDPNTSKCINDFKFNGTWENTGNNKYKSTDGKTGKSETSEIIFRDNNNTMAIGTSIYKRK